MIRQSTRGIAALDVPAITSFPPPSFLTSTQTNLWIACLSDVPLEFFRARHIPVLIQYVRAVEKMMHYSDLYEADPDDIVSLNMWDRLMRIATRLERQLSFHTTSLISRTTRATGEARVAAQTKRAKEAGKSGANARAGLIYVGY
jgi:hypothetical protein